MEAYEFIPAALKVVQKIVNRYGNGVHSFILPNKNPTPCPYTSSIDPYLELILVPQTDALAFSLKDYSNQLNKTERKLHLDMPITIFSPLTMYLPLIKHREIVPGVFLREPKLVYYPEFKIARQKIEQSIPLYLGKGKLTGLDRALFFHSQWIPEAEGIILRHTPVKDFSKIIELEKLAKDFGKDFPFLNTTLDRLHQLKFPDSETIEPDRRDVFVIL